GRSPSEVIVPTAERSASSSDFEDDAAAALDPSDRRSARGSPCRRPGGEQRVVFSTVEGELEGRPVEARRGTNELGAERSCELLRGNHGADPARPGEVACVPRQAVGHVERRAGPTDERRAVLEARARPAERGDAPCERRAARAPRGERREPRGGEPNVAEQPKLVPHARAAPREG